MSEIDNRPLRVKALETAINQMKAAKNREEANTSYRFWEVFHTDSEYLAAIKAKQEQFKKSNNE